MKKFTATLLLGIFIGASAVAFAVIVNLRRRVDLLEQRCDARCLYGDAECAARCAKAGHCPFQKED